MSLLRQKVENKRITDLENIWNELRDTVKDLKEALPAFHDVMLHTNSIDDRKLLLEYTVHLMARFGGQNSPPKCRKLAEEVQKVVIDLLYKDLPHPPASFMCLPVSMEPLDKPANYAFRTADGSYYNPFSPAIGMAGMPYARSVPAATPTPPASLPDPGVLFDTLLARDKFEPHPGGINSLFFAFADLVIHSVFNTRLTDETINDASSYLDLSILYGSSEDAVNSIRQKDGTGRLLPDVFADSRLLHMPPASGALLVLLCRNHNYIAQKILEIDERKTYNKHTTPKELQDQDDDIFNRARLVNCGFFMQIILRDYVGSILGLARDGSEWRLDPLAAARALDHDVCPRGEGNVVSIEFNLLYRWHATLSQMDSTWTERMFQHAFKGKDLQTLTPDDFKIAATKELRPSGPPTEWTIPGLKRQTSGPFKGQYNDDDLAKLIWDATEARAASFKARGTPHALRVIEIMSIEQSRRWGACTMNEFRKFIGLKPFTDFKEWNENKDIAATAEKLYNHIDNLELYIGLQAEQAKNPGPGAGLCPGYTISRAILADAVALTRGDRFLTVDFTPHNLTSWGFLYCQCDHNDGSYGGMLTKLLLRTLPNHFQTRSAYTHFPFLDPKWMESHMKGPTGRPLEAKKYDWRRPSVPKPTIVLDTHQDVEHVVSKPKIFASGYEDRLAAIVGPNELPYHTADVAKIIVSDADKWATSFENSTKELIKEKSYGFPGSPKQTLDVVQDVINLLPVRWIIKEVAGLPMTEDQWRIRFADVCQYLLVNLDTVDEWALRESSRQTFEDFIKIVRGHFDKFGSVVRSSVFRSSLDRRLKIGHVSNFLEDAPHARLFLKKVHDHVKDNGHRELAASLFTEIVPTAAHFSQAIAIAFNYYMSDDRAPARAEIVSLAAKRSKENNRKICDYIHEALYADPLVSATYRTVLQDTELASSRKLRAGDVVYASITAANLDSSRPAGAGVLPTGEHGLLDSVFFEAVAPRILGVLLTELKNVQIVKGFNQFTERVHGTLQRSFIDGQGYVRPWPDSLVVQYAV